LAEDSTPSRATGFCRAGLAPWLATPDARVTEADYAWILARPGASGRIVLHPLPRFPLPFREFQYRGYIAGGRDPGSPVSGNEAIRVLGKVMDANSTSSGAQPVKNFSFS